VNTHATELATRVRYTGTVEYHQLVLKAIRKNALNYDENSISYVQRMSLRNKPLQHSTYQSRYEPQCQSTKLVDSTKTECLREQIIDEVGSTFIVCNQQKID
jgi:hypothetical protein